MGWLTGLIANLSRVHPLAYVAIYLVAVPAFGFAYVFFCAHQFYAPYARYEPGAVADRLALASDFRNAIKRSLDGQAHISVRSQGIDWAIDPESVRISNVGSVDGSQVTFTVLVDAGGEGQHVGAETHNWPVTVLVPLRPFNRVFNPSVLTYRAPELENASPSQSEVSEPLLRTVFNQPPDSIMHGPFLALDAVQNDRLERYLLGFRGDASAFSGHVARMMYLSAVVITTLGLGDILPMTTRARFLVAAEAISGIVLAGLFLNAIAYRASERRSSPRS
jgi:hypothetical protein